MPEVIRNLSDAAAVLSGDWDEDGTITIDLPAALAAHVLLARGWRRSEWTGNCWAAPTSDVAVNTAEEALQLTLTADGIAAARDLNDAADALGLTHPDYPDFAALRERVDLGRCDGARTIRDGAAAMDCTGCAACAEAPENVAGRALLYAHADALGMPYDPGFADEILARRVALGLCHGGIVHEADGGSYPCAGCAACDTPGAPVDALAVDLDGLPYRVYNDAKLSPPLAVKVGGAPATLPPLGLVYALED